jgi:hypothetical protein
MSIMKRLALVLLSILWASVVHACILTTHVGACSLQHPISPPSILPQKSSLFGTNAGNGETNNPLRPNGGTAGAFFPPTPSTGSLMAYFEPTVDPALGYGSTSAETIFPTTFLAGNGPGLPAWFTQRGPTGGQPGTQWTFAISIAGAAQTTGAGYFSGRYVFTAHGGGIGGSDCLRPPVGVWAVGIQASITDPGFGCMTTPTVDVSQIPGDGAQQSVVPSSTSCAAGTTGQMVVTTTVPIAHGITPGLTYPLNGFTQTGGTSINTTFTATGATTATTLVGTAAGTCPTPGTIVDTAGKVLAGVNGAVTLTAISVTNPYGSGGTGITSKNSQHACMAFGEYGSDSNFPGAQFFIGTDERGNQLPGSPAVSPYLNQGTANWKGHTLVNTQSPSSPALVVDSMTSYPLAASPLYTAASGSTPAKVTFTFSGALPGFMPGSEFTVSGFSSTGASINKTYVADGSTTRSGASVTGIPLSGPLGMPLALATPGTITGTGALVSVIMPGMQIIGTTNGSLISPFGTFGGTGVGGVGTYGLTTNQTATSTFTVVSVNVGAQTITTSGTPAPAITVGTTFTLNSNTYVVTQVNGGGNFTLNTGSGLAAGTATNQGIIGSSGTPAQMFGFPAFFQTAAASVAGATGGGTVTLRSAASVSDFFGTIGAGSVNAGAQHAWGGALANVSLVQGVFPQTSAGGPDPTQFASLCQKSTTDIPTFAAANGMTVESLYELNDPGIFGDSSRGDITASITGSPTTPVLNVTSSPLPTLASGSVISGAGLVGCDTGACPVVATGGPYSGPTYPLTFTGTAVDVASEAMKAGAFKPATPVAGGVLTGNVTTTSGVSTLHVTAIPTANSAQFKGVLGNLFTGNIPIGNTLNVTATNLTDGYTALTIGTTISGNSNIPAGTKIIGMSSTTFGGTGAYTLDHSVTTAVASSSLFASGTLPGASSSLSVSGVSGTIVASMIITDGGVNISNASPIQTGSGPTTLADGQIVWNLNQTYYPTDSAGTPISYTGLIGTIATVVPGQHIFGANILNPVSITGLGSSGAFGLLGDYPLSGSPTASGSLASQAISLTGIADGPSVAPGPALTIKDLGAGVIFPVLNYGAGTGTVNLEGLFDTSYLRGTPTNLQARVSLTAGGDPVPGCTACDWTPLSGYSAALSSGTVWRWSGQLLNVPASSGFLYVTVRVNSTTYATMASPIKVGLVFDIYTEGNGSALATTGGTANSYHAGLWGTVNWSLNTLSNAPQGPAVSPTTFLPGQAIMYPGDRYSVLNSGVPIPEAQTNLMQFLSNSFGWTSEIVNVSHDGVGLSPWTLGGATQVQTAGLGNGTATTFCSVAKFCGSPSGVVGQGPLFFTAAALTGASITASISTNTLATTAVFGALEPGMVLTGGGISGSLTIANCVSGCQPTTSIPQAQTWTTAGPSQAIGAGAVIRAEPAAGAAPWPNFNIQAAGLPFLGNTAITGSGLVAPGTFQVLYNGVAVCKDTTVFAYNNQGGNCLDLGTGHTVTAAWVNYARGDYQVTFAAAPSSSDVITVSWNYLATPEANNSANLRPNGLDYFFNGSPTSGAVSNSFSKTPGGLSFHLYAGGISDNFATFFPNGACGYTQEVSWLYNTKYPTLIPGQSASTPFLSGNYWRSEGANQLIAPGVAGNAPRTESFDAWSVDVGTASNFSGTISGGVLTLTAAATGRMWEGEVLAGNGIPACVITITSRAGGAWGAIGSTYNLAAISGVTVPTIGTATAMTNAVYYLGPSPAFYIGPANDLNVQNSLLAGSTNQGAHPTKGFAGGRRIAARWAAGAMGAMTTPANASNATLDRSIPTGCTTPSPCLDVGTGGAGGSFAASHSGTIQGAQITITGGISPHALPFVVGQEIFCTGCAAGHFIKSIDVPSTADQRAGAGEVNQTFHVTADASLLAGPTTEAVSAGCASLGAGQSNCLNILIKQNTTAGTFGTAWALATCGENNLNGTAPNYQPAAGICQTNGIGSLVRNFRIGTQQAMWPFNAATGSPYDDGVDLGGSYNQSGAFSCHIVAAKEIQCVKGVAYTITATPSLSVALGQWTAGSTYLEYGDALVGTGRYATYLGSVGGQSYPFVAGSGYSPDGTFTVTGTCATVASGATLPKVDVTFSGGKIVNVYGSPAASSAASMGLGIGSSCSFALPGAVRGGSGASIGDAPLAPTDGVAGIGTYNTDSNWMGDDPYGNEGLPGNPLNMFFTNGFGGYFEPGMPLTPIGLYLGAQVSG